MEFLVQIDVSMPMELPEEERADLLSRERALGRAYLRDGQIKHVWRVPGGLRNIGVWEAEDATDLHEALAALPLFPWMRIEVTPLARHPITVVGA
ncbi:MAG: muconolactone Delta-isomerase family protein [Actinobacteria bacterium]|nr:muconolactone Delta-isomerase family protein [Actinomycetota bacterium]